MPNNPRDIVTRFDMVNAGRRELVTFTTVVVDDAVQVSAHVNSTELQGSPWYVSANGNSVSISPPRQQSTTVVGELTLRGGAGDGRPGVVHFAGTINTDAVAQVDYNGPIAAFGVT